MHLVDAPLECVVLGAGRCLESFESLKGMFMAPVGSARMNAVTVLAVIDPASSRRRSIRSPGTTRSISGSGVITKGQSVMAEMVTEDQLPDFRGRSVLDIGAWDGYYSFLAERRGAARVVALDHYAWGVDFTARTQYWNECLERGVLPDQSRDTTDFWRADLPGRRGFDLAHRALESRVEPVVADFTTIDLSTLGHVRHRPVPRRALPHEGAAHVPGAAARGDERGRGDRDGGRAGSRATTGGACSSCTPGGELNADFGNWYVPTIEALGALARASGFARVEVMRGPPSLRVAWTYRAASAPRAAAAVPIPRPPTTAPSSTRST